MRDQNAALLHGAKKHLRISNCVEASISSTLKVDRWLTVKDAEPDRSPEIAVRLEPGFN
jgi:hypothetical protein